MTTHYPRSWRTRRRDGATGVTRVVLRRTLRMREHQGVDIREATAEDADFLLDMLVEACNWSGQQRITRAAARADPRLLSYVSDWPRDHDVGVIARDEHGVPVGAAWARTFSERSRGYGYVAAGVPEISMAVVASWRAKGVGRRLLATLIAMARQRRWPALSLSVEDGNRAQSLYRAAGFITVGRNGTSDTMQLVLQAHEEGAEREIRVVEGLA